MRTGKLAACTTFTVLGLPDAPAAVTVMTPVRMALSGFASAVAWMVPELLPLLPDVMWSQAAPTVTVAVQPMAPPPVLETVKDVVLPGKSTF